MDKIYYMDFKGQNEIIIVHRTTRWGIEFSCRKGFRPAFIGKGLMHYIGEL